MKTPTPTPERTRYGWNVEGLDLTTFSDLSSFCQTNPWLRVTFDHQLVSPYCLRQLTQKDVSHTLGCLYGLVLERRTVCDKRASALYRSLSRSARCAAILPLRILCFTSCINQYYTGRGDSVTEMCTLMADSLLTGLPSLVKPTGSFSETKAYIASFYTHNKLPSSPAAIYLPFNSCHLSFLAIVFSCLLAWPLVPLERSMWISGSVQVFFPTNMPRFCDWPITVSLKLPISLNILGNIKDHTLQGARVQPGATAIQESSLFPFPLFSRGLVSVQRCWRRRMASMGGKGEEEEAASLPAFVSIMCHGRSWLSCSVWLSLLLQQSLFPHWKSVSLRGRRRFLLHPFQLNSA